MKKWDKMSPVTKRFIGEIVKLQEKDIINNLVKNNAYAKDAKTILKDMRKLYCMSFDRAIKSIGKKKNDTRRI